MVLRFKAFYNLYVSEVCQCEVFSTVYTLFYTQGTRYFVLQSRIKKIIVNMVDSDHGMRDIMVCGQVNHRMIVGSFRLFGT